MKILILGGNGQLGFELTRAAWAPGDVIASLPYPDFDVTRAGDVEKAVADHAPDLVVNATAHTAVDKAESEAELAFAINRDGPAAMATTCAAQGIPLIHISTDYVFDGAKPTPYVEDDPIAPLGVYGASKAAGEEAVRTSAARHVILRTSWVYSAYGNNFVKTMLRFGRERDEMRVVADQTGGPTAAADLAVGIVKIASRIAAGDGEALWGTYHLTGGGVATWHSFAERIFQRLEERTGKRPRLVAIQTSDYPTPARRPANSRLDCSRAKERLGVVFPPWEESLDRVLNELFTNPPQA